MKLEIKQNCPLDGFKPCRQLECSWFVQVRGKNPTTGADVDEWNCAIAWMPLLTLEVASQARQTGAAVESFRNEVAAAGEKTNQPQMIPFVPLARFLGAKET